MRYSLLRTRSRHGGRFHRHGMAMMMVIFFTTIAAVMVYAILESSVSQANIASNQAPAASADAMAESGVELASYYLEYPLQAPSLTAAVNAVPVYWTGANNIKFSGMNGSVNVAISADGTSGTLWNVTSTGTYTYPNGTTLSKTISAVMNGAEVFQVKQALASNTALHIGSSTTATITNASGPALVSDAAITIGSHGSVSGSVSSPSVGGGYTGSTLVAMPSNPVPPYADLYPYKNGYYKTVGGNNILYAVDTLVSGVISNILSLLGIGTNPGNINYYNGNMSISSGLLGLPTSETGTFICSGNLTITGSGVLTITTAMQGIPAIVCGGTITVDSSASLTVNGLVYAGDGLAGSSQGPLTINGGLLIDQGGIPSAYNGKLTVTYNASNVSFNPSGYSVPPFAQTYTQFMTPQAVKLTSWTQ